MMCRVFCFALILLGASGVNGAVVRSNTFLAVSDGDRMQPELVAQTLANVQDEWKKQAIAFTLQGSKEAPASFANSCGTIISAVVQGSDGKRDVAKEYMTTVCNQKVLEGWHKLRCSDLTTAIVDHAMSADNFANRESLNSRKLCTSFWSKFVDEERKREAEEAKERAAREEKEAKERVEREKKEAAEQAAAKKKAEADAKIEAERRKQEEEKEQQVEARRKQEEKEQNAKAEALEAKARAAEAAANLAQKRYEAEAVQKAAQEKFEEAAKAEEEHKKLVAEHEHAEEILHSAKTEKAKLKGEVVAKTPAKESKPATVKATEPAAPVVKSIAPAPQVKEPVAPKPEPKQSPKAKVAPQQADVAAKVPVKTTK